MKENFIEIYFMLKIINCKNIINSLNYKKYVNTSPAIKENNPKIKILNGRTLNCFLRKNTKRRIPPNKENIKYSKYVLLIKIFKLLTYYNL